MPRHSLYLRHSAFRALTIVVLSVAAAACDIAADGQGGFDFGVAAGQARDEWTRSYPVGEAARLELININGRITAEPAAGRSIEVRAERIAKANTDQAAQEQLARIEMREEVSQERVRIEVRVPRGEQPATWRGHDVQWTIGVPAGVSVDLRTVNGGVKVTGIGDDVRARATNGGITGMDLRATSLDASVTNGGVEIALAQPVTSGSFELEAVNGGVSLALPAESKADVSGRAVNGRVTAASELGLESSGEPSERRLEGRMNGGGARITLETVNGGVKVTRASNPSRE